MEALTPRSPEGQRIVAMFARDLPKLGMEDLFMIGFIFTAPLVRSDEIAMECCKLARAEYARRPTPKHG